MTLVTIVISVVTIVLSLHDLSEKTPLVATHQPKNSQYQIDSPDPPLLFKATPGKSQGNPTSHCVKVYLYFHAFSRQLQPKYWWLHRPENFERASYPKKKSPVCLLSYWHYLDSSSVPLVGWFLNRSHHTKKDHQITSQLWRLDMSKRI